MKKVIWSCNDYCIKSVDVRELYKLVAFVVRENYSHHSLNISTSNIRQEEINDIYVEELSFATMSQYFIAYDKAEDIIGCIRVFKWDCKTAIPMHKIFKISPLEKINTSFPSTFWHIGRFAITSGLGFSTVKLFKQLMILAIAPILKERCGYMLAEIDTHLLQIMNALDIETQQLGNPVRYLSSETIPVYSNKNGLLKFYKKYSSLMQN